MKSVCLADGGVDTSLGNGNVATEALHTVLSEFVIVQILFLKLHLHFTAEELEPVSSFQLEANVLKVELKALIQNLL